MFTTLSGVRWVMASDTLPSNTNASAEYTYNIAYPNRERHQRSVSVCVCERERERLTCPRKRRPPERRGVAKSSRDEARLVTGSPRPRDT